MRRQLPLICASSLSPLIDAGPGGPAACIPFKDYANGYNLCGCFRNSRLNPYANVDQKNKWIQYGAVLAWAIPGARGRPVLRRSHAMSDETQEALRTLVARAGLKLTPTQYAELGGVFPKLEAMAARLRKPRPVSAEPAAVFSPKV
jgi:hypothetical protein